MKITCDNCGAKYSIADEKVRGKVFKIRCKKCSHIVVVRGASGGDERVAAEPATTAAPAAAEPAEASAAVAGVMDGPKWHVVVGCEQVGPCSVDEIRERFARAEINADSFVWREGFADWMRLGVVEEFSDLAQSPLAGGLEAAQTEAEQSGSAAAMMGLAGAEREVDQPASDLGGGIAPQAAAAADERALFSAGAAASAEEPAPKGNNGQGQSANLFAGAPAGGHRSMFGDEDDDEGSDLAHPQMTGQRGENSVLFSLANLQALAMGESAGASPAAGVAPSAAGPMTASPGAAGESSSGLIDIRAMAAASAAAAPKSAVDDDLPAMSGFHSPVAAAPVLLPSSTSDRPRWLLPLLIGLGALFVLAVVLLVVLINRPPLVPDAPPTALASNGVVASSSAAESEVQPKAAGAVEPEPAAAAEAKAAGEAEGEGSAEDTASSAAAKQAAEPPRATKRATRRRAATKRRPRRSTKTSSARAARSSAPAQKPRKQAGPRDELDRLLDSSMGARRAARGSSGSRQPSAADSNLPRRLSRSQIVSGMRAVRGRVQSCYDRYKVPGLADVRLKIASTGRVKSALVKGLFAGTPTGACVRKAVMSARFPRFKTPTMSITYPFMLR